MDDRLAALERENELLKQQLKNSEGLIALGELAGTTTHEFNNIIMTVMNYAKLGLRHKDDAMRERRSILFWNPVKRRRRLHSAF